MNKKNKALPSAPLSLLPPPSLSPSLSPSLAPSLSPSLASSLSLLLSLVYSLILPLLLSLVLSLLPALLLSGCDMSRAAPLHSDAAEAASADTGGGSNSSDGDSDSPGGTEDGVSAGDSAAGSADDTSPRVPAANTSPRVPDNSVLDAGRQESAAEDRLLASMKASVETSVGSKVLRVDAVGTLADPKSRTAAVREVRVYGDDSLLQTIPANGTDGLSRAGTAEDAVRVRDANYDGADDVEIVDTPSDGITLHTFWLWDTEAEAFRKTWTMQNVTVDENARELTTVYQYAKNVDFADTYQFDASGERVLVRRYVEDWRHGTDDFPLVAYYEFPDGVRTLVRQEFTHYNDEGIPTREVRAMVDGELIPVRLEELRVSGGVVTVIRTEELYTPEPEEGNSASESGDSSSETGDSRTESGDSSEAAEAASEGEPAGAELSAEARAEADAASDAAISAAESSAPPAVSAGETEEQP